MVILITGCAGFVGYHLSKKLLENNFSIEGIDNLNTYYDVELKKDRLKLLKKYSKFNFSKVDISNEKKLSKIFLTKKIKIVINLAAQAGVRFSIKKPEAYLKSNIIGFFNILDISRKHKVKHFIFASTSSVYGDNKKFPLNENENTDKPLNFYAATKKSNEVMAYSYSNIHKLKVTGLRFFTVYGPFGRPDMALFKFTKAIRANKYVKLFNKGDHTRDFTYIDDVVESIFKLLNKPSNDKIPYQVLNVGSNNPIKLKSFLNEIKLNLKLKVKVKNLPFQQGDIKKTHADISTLVKKIKFKPNTNIKYGIKNFINWYKSYYN